MEYLSSRNFLSLIAPGNNKCCVKKLELKHLLIEKDWDIETNDEGNNGACRLDNDEFRVQGPFMLWSKNQQHKVQNGEIADLSPPKLFFVLMKDIYIKID
jgi:hypothetical protein